MKINNPLQLNDWEIEKFLKVVLAIQIAMWGAICLDAVGLQIPIIRPLIGFIYLTFVPGILILRILRLHKLSNIETLLYTVGLSLSTLMFTGFFMNMIYPFFGISGPLSPVPLIITISAVVLVLCVLCYMRDKDFADPDFVDVAEVLSPPVLFLCLIPFMAVLGTYLVNFYHTNILLMLMIVVIALVALLIGFDKFIPAKLYPLAIWVMAISLIWHRTLITNYIQAYDVYGEFYVANLIISDRIWDPAAYYFGSYSSVLSVTITPPIFYYIGNIDLTWVYKLIFPLFLSFIPLGIYHIFIIHIDDKMSFLATFLFIATSFFYGQSPFLTKQLFAEIFLVLLFMLILNKNINKIKRSFLLIVFGASLIVSHYGTSYLVMFSLIFVLLFLYLTENQMIKGLWKRFYFIFERKDWAVDNLNVQRKGASLNFVLLFITFTLAWYIYISSSSAFNAIVQVGDHIANTIFTEFLSPEHSRGMYMLTKETRSPLYEIYRFFHLIVQFFISVGILRLLLKPKEMKFEREYIGFSLYWFIICIAAIVVGSFAVMNPGRLYHLSLFLLAPFAIIGGITIFEVIIKIFMRSWTSKMLKHSLKVLSVFLVIFLLFNTGFIFEIVKDHSNSISLSQESVKKYGDVKDKGGVYITIVSTYDVFSSKWLSKNMDQNKKIYATLGYGQGYTVLMAYGNIPPPKVRSITNKTTSITNSYIYLYYFNVVEKIRLDCDPLGKYLTFSNMTDIYPLLKDKSLIYDNGGSEILWS